MPFPISVGDLWKMFEFANAWKIANKRAVTDWLDAVYADLTELEKVWVDICSGLNTDELSDNLHKGLGIIWRTHSDRDQYFYAGRLQKFYHAASSVLQKGGESEFSRDFIDSLGTLLKNRSEARELLDMGRMSLLDDSYEMRWRAEMEVKLRSIQEDIASLQVLIKTFKAVG